MWRSPLKGETVSTRGNRDEVRECLPQEFLGSGVWDGEPRTDADRLWLVRIRIEPRRRFDARILWCREGDFVFAAVAYGYLGSIE